MHRGSVYRLFGKTDRLQLFVLKLVETERGTNTSVTMETFMMETAVTTDVRSRKDGHVQGELRWERVVVFEGSHNFRL